MKRFDLAQILKSAGGDGASLQAPNKKHRIFQCESFTMEPDSSGVEHDVDVIVATPRRWERLASRKSWRCDQYTTMNIGPVVVAIRISR